VYGLQFVDLARLSSNSPRGNFCCGRDLEQTAAHKLFLVTSEARIAGWVAVIYPVGVMIDEHKLANERPAISVNGLAIRVKALSLFAMKLGYQNTLF
jgi:hypothetical protein